MAKMLGRVSNWAECACFYCGPSKAPTRSRARDRLRRSHRRRERNQWVREARDE